MSANTHPRAVKRILGDKHFLMEFVDVCRNCGGSGATSLVSLHKDKHTGICPICEGSGRVMIKKEIKIELTPFK